MRNQYYKGTSEGRVKMKTWNFGIVGAGLIADFHARAIGDIPNAGLTGFCDTVPDKARKLAQKYSCRAYNDTAEMMADDSIDLVTIATPSGVHMEPAVAAAQAGKHVICEKPLDISLERIDAMIEAHNKAGTKLGGVFQNRFSDAITPLRQAIQAERFGKITYAGVYVPWWRTDEYYDSSWHGTWKMDGGGALMNQAIHMIDMMCDLMPPVESVQAFMGSLGHQIETEDTAVAVLRFVGGALGVIYGTTASCPGQLKRFEITGTKGTVVYLEDSFSVWQFAEQLPQDEQIRRRFGQVGQEGAGVADPAAISYQNHTKNFQAFLDALENKNNFPISGTEARKSVELVLAVYQAAREQKIVKLS